jgi:hypothetical protein
MKVKDIAKIIERLYDHHQTKYDEHATTYNFNRYSLDYHEGAMDALDELWTEIKPEDDGEIKLEDVPQKIDKRLARYLKKMYENYPNSKLINYHEGAIDALEELQDAIKQKGGEE